LDADVVHRNYQPCYFQKYFGFRVAVAFCIFHAEILDEIKNWRMKMNHNFYQKIHKELVARFGNKFTITDCSDCTARFTANKDIHGYIFYGKIRKNFKEKVSTGWNLQMYERDIYGEELSQLFDEVIKLKVSEMEKSVKFLQKALRVK
jgi:hypothetical protein